MNIFNLSPEIYIVTNKSNKFYQKKLRIVNVLINYYLKKIKTFFHFLTHLEP